MNRKRSLKIVLVAVGLLFSAGVIPLNNVFLTRACDTNDNEHLCHSRSFLAA